MPNHAPETTAETAAATTVEQEATAVDQALSQPEPAAEPVPAPPASEA